MDKSFEKSQLFERSYLFLYFSFCTAFSNLLTLLFKPFAMSSISGVWIKDENPGSLTMDFK